MRGSWIDNSSILGVINMKVTIGGPLSVYEEVKKLAAELEQTGIECAIPKDFRGRKDPEKIEQEKEKLKQGKSQLTSEDLGKIAEVETWFLDQIREADFLIIHNKKKRGREILEGYTGVNTSIDIGCALGADTPVILTYQPSDVGLKALVTSKRFTEQVKVIEIGAISEYLEKTE